MKHFSFLALAALLFGPLFSFAMANPEAKIHIVNLSQTFGIHHLEAFTTQSRGEWEIFIDEKNKENQHILAHEQCHVIWFMWLEKNERDAYQQWFTHVGAEHFITKYGNRSAEEHFAEACAEYRTQENTTKNYEKKNAGLMNWIDEIHKKHDDSGA